MRIRVTRRIEFSSSHTYSIPGASIEENRRLFGECVHHHGHNYMLEATVSGPTDARTGMVVNLTDLKAALREITGELDHKNLNLDVPHFKARNPTTENIALFLWDRLGPRVRPCELENVTLHEDDSLSVEVNRA